MNSSFANNAKEYGSRSAKYVYDEMCDGGPIGIFAYLILAVMIGLFCKVISVNVIPYAIVFGDTLPVASGIPIIGWAWDTLTLMYTAMGSFMAWAMLNLGQCLWIMISLDRKVHSKVISEMNAEHKMQGMEGRSGSVDIRNMQRKGIKLPAAILTYSGFIALGCYIAEAIVNFKAYPPVSDFSRFMVSIQLGKFEIFNVENIVKLLWGMFSTEIFVVVIIIVWMWTQARKSDATESY